MDDIWSEIRGLTYNELVEFACVLRDTVDGGEWDYNNAYDWARIINDAAHSQIVDGEQP